MQTVTTDESRGAGPWAGLHVPVIPPCGWTRAEVLSGLREVERVRRRVDAACALLVGALGPSDRGTAALVAEAAGVSYKAARDQVLVAEVVERLDGASEALASGAVSAEHLRMLAPVADDPALVRC